MSINRRLKKENGNQIISKENGDDINSQLYAFLQKGEEEIRKYMERKKQMLIDNIELEQKKEIGKFKDGVEFTVLEHNIKIIKSKVKISVDKEDKIISLNQKIEEKDELNLEKNKSNNVSHFNK